MRQLDLFGWASGVYNLQDLDHSCPDCLEYSSWLEIDADETHVIYECQAVREDDLPCGRAIEVPYPIKEIEHDDM